MYDIHCEMLNWVWDAALQILIHEKFLQSNPQGCDRKDRCFTEWILSVLERGLMFNSGGETEIESFKSSEATSGFSVSESWLC